MKTLTVLKEYPGSHHYVVEYTKCDYYCPNCGHKEVWFEDGMGDYYLGQNHVCLACEHWFYLPNDPDQWAEPAYKGIIQQIRDEKTNTPTTPGGQ